MATTVASFLATSSEKRTALIRVNAFVSSIDGQLYIEERDPAGAGTSVDITGPFGQEPMATSFPVVLASDQSNVPVLKMNTLVTVPYDTILPNLAGATTDIYVFKTGGIGGATVATLTIEYADATKAVISSVVRT